MSAVAERRLSTRGRIVGLALGLVFGFAMGVAVAAKAFGPDEAAVPGIGPGGSAQVVDPRTGVVVGQREASQCARELPAPVDPSSAERAEERSTTDCVGYLRADVPGPVDSGASPVAPGQGLLPVLPVPASTTPSG